MNVLGVILARGGSAGLKDKHLLPLLGRPVIAYTLDHARLATRLARVVVTSDCARILHFAAGNGFATIRRPAGLATATASVQDVMLHAMKSLEAQDGSVPDALAVLYGNVAVREDDIIDRAIDVLERTGADSVRSFCPVGKWHPAWMSKLSGDRAIALQPGSIDRRQDLEPLFLHDGGIVAVSRESMLKGQAAPHDPHAFFGTDRRGIEVPAGANVEIDTLRDLFWAEAVLRHQQAEGHPRLREAS